MGAFVLMFITALKETTGGAFKVVRNYRKFNIICGRMVIQVMHL